MRCRNSHDTHGRVVSESLLHSFPHSVHTFFRVFGGQQARRVTQRWYCVNLEAELSFGLVCGQR